MLNEMASVRLDVTKRVLETINLVLALAEQYRYLGKTFTFSFDEDLDTQVNKMLIALTDGIMDDNDERVASAISFALDDEDIDEDAIYDYVNREQNGMTRLVRFDLYSSRLKHLLEAWIAIEFAKKLSQGQIRTEILANMGNPNASELWREAMDDIEYNADFSLDYGQGVSKNLIDGFTLTGQNSINEAFQYAMLLGFVGRGDVVGYRVHRGSTYDCPYCDELCEGVHPLTEMVLPAHPRCCCYMTPVLIGQSGEED